MSKLSRVIQRIFGENAVSSQFGQFGSNAASPPGTTTKDLTVIQALSQFGLAWYSATANAAEPPRIQDRNALDLLFSSQLVYLMQNGIPEWLDDSDQRYYADVSFVTKSQNIYMAIKGDDGSNINAEKDPDSEPTWWTIITLPLAIENDLTSSNITHTLPAVHGGPQRFDIFWSNGGTYKLTMAVTDSETIGGLAAATWEGEGEGFISVISDGTNWQVRDYRDSGSIATSGANKDRRFAKLADGSMRSTGYVDTSAAAGFTLATYAHTFISLESILVTLDSAGSAGYSMSGNPGLSSANLYQSITQVQKLRYEVIGRWMT